MRRVLSAALTTLAVVALVAAPLVAAETPRAQESRAESNPISFTFIATGLDSSVDGHLETEPDEYGGFGAFGYGPGFGRDSYNPVGPLLDTEVTFTDAFFLSVPALSQRALLSDNMIWQSLFPGDPVPLVPSIVAPSVASDTNGDGTPDTIDSSFRVDSVDVAIAADLRSTVHTAGGAATLRQDYTFTNEGASMVTVVLTRVFDGDLLYDGDFTSDEVGTLTNAGGRGLFVFQREPGDSATGVTIHGPGAMSYFGGKNGINPGDGSGIPYGFGTDVQVWENFGMPDNWVNNIAGLGYDTDGTSGSTPAGCDVGNGCDAFTGLDWELTLMPGVPTDVTVFHTYGSIVPVVGGISVSGSCPGPVDIVIEGGTPGGLAAILRGTGTGSDALPGGPCAGSVSGLSGVSLLKGVSYDADGRIEVSPSVPSAGCGTVLQVLDVSTCGLSNVVTIN